MNTNWDLQTRFILSRTTRVVAVFALLFGYTGLGLAAGGTLDTTFGTASSGIVYTDTNAGSSDEVQALVLDTDGKIIAAGSSNADIVLTRYTTAGILDTTFNNDGISILSIGSAADVAYDVIIEDNGKILVAGATNDGVNDHIFVARFNTNGDPDTAFGTNGVVVTSVTVGGDDIAHALTLQADGKILVAGEINSDFAVLRYDDNGDLDTTFGGGDGIATSDFFGSPDRALAIALQPDSKILLAGEIDNGLSNDFALARYHTDGSLDTTFGVNGLVNTDFGGQTNEFALSLGLQDDGKIVLGGYRSGADDDFALARYDTDGSLDATFGANGLVTSHLTANDDQAYGVSIQATGRIVLAGVTNSGAPTNEDLLVARYTPSGALDTAFGAGGSTISDIGSHLPAGANTADLGLALALQPDDKILVGGSTDYPLATGDLNFFVARYDSPNSAPTVTDVTRSGTEDNPVSFAATDFSAQFSDPDGDILRKIQVLSLPADGTLTLSAVPVSLNQEIPAHELGNLVYTPQADFSGSTSFIWNGSDGLYYAAAPANVNLSLAGVNDAPVLDPIGNQSGNEQTLITFTASASDPDPADTLTYSLDLGAPAGVSLDPASGMFSWIPSEEQGPGVYTVTLRVTDNGIPGASDFETFTITVNEANTAPVLALIGDQTVAEETLISFTASATDSDLPANILTFSLDPGAPAGAGIDPASGLFSWTPSEDQSPGDYQILLRVTDNGAPNLGASELFTVTVNEVNDAPSFTGGPDIGVPEDTGPQTVSAWATDITPGPGDEASQTVTFTLATGNTALFATTPSIDPANGDLAYTPADNASGTALITVTLQDDGGTAYGGIDVSLPYTFTINVSPVDDAPMVSNFSKIGWPNQVISFTLSDFTSHFSDADNDPLVTIQITGFPDAGSLELDGVPVSAGQEIEAQEAVIQTLTYTPGLNWTGTAVFTWNGSDGAVYADSPASIAITITNQGLLFLPLVLQAP